MISLVLIVQGFVFCFEFGAFLYAHLAELFQGDFSTAAAARKGTVLVLFLALTLKLVGKLSFQTGKKVFPSLDIVGIVQFQGLAVCFQLCFQLVRQIIHVHGLFGQQCNLDSGLNFRVLQLLLELGHLGFVAGNLALKFLVALGALLQFGNQTVGRFQFGCLTSQDGFQGIVFRLTHIITPAKVYDPNNEFDQEYFEFGLFMSRREYKTIKRRLEAGKKQSVMEGNYILPQRVFGYDILRTSKKDRTLVIRPEEEKYVQMIFDWHINEKRSTGWMARQLTLMGVPTIKGRPEWNRGTVRDMLANPIYAGKVTWGKRRTIKEYDPEQGKLVKVVKEDGEMEIYEGKHQGIISEERFALAQHVTETMKNPSAKVSTELKNPFAGLMKCNVCGRNIIAMTFKDGRRSRLSHARDTICTKKSLPIDDVVEVFIGTLTGYIADFESKMAQDDNRAELEAHKARMDAMETELAKLERKRKNLFADYEDDVYTRDEFIERKLHYNGKIDALKKQIQAARKSTPEPVDYSEQIVNLNAMIDCMRNPALSAKQKNNFLKQFIEKITYDSIDYGQRRGGKAVLEVFLK